MLLHEIVETSRRVSETSARLQKTELLAACLRRAGPQEEHRFAERWRAATRDLRLA